MENKKYLLRILIFAFMFSVVLFFCATASAVKADEEEIPAYSLIVEGGQSVESGPFKAGDSVTVECLVPEGMVFNGWQAEGVILSEEQLASPKFTFIMPDDAHVKLVATFKEKTGVTPYIIIGVAAAMVIAIAVIVCVLIRRKIKNRD